jgi:hypothetical protein
LASQQEDLVDISIGPNQNIRLPRQSLKLAGEFFASFLSFSESATLDDSAIMMDTESYCEIDLSKIVSPDEAPGVRLILALAHLHYSSPESMKFLIAPHSEISLALLLADVFQISHDLFKGLLEERLDSAASIFQVLDAMTKFSTVRPLSMVSLKWLAALQVSLRGCQFIDHPLALGGFRCEACVNDRDEKGFCRSCLNAVYCVPCFKADNDTYPLNAEFQCSNCAKTEKYTFASRLKLYKLDWVMNAFKVFCPAIYLHDAYKREEFVNPFNFKKESGFESDGIKILDVLSDSELPIVEKLMPYVKMLASI